MVLSFHKTAGGSCSAFPSISKGRLLQYSASKMQPYDLEVMHRTVSSILRTTGSNFGKERGKTTYQHHPQCSPDSPNAAATRYCLLRENEELLTSRKQFFLGVGTLQN